MSLSLDSLKQAGAFTGAPVEKEIVWKQKGKEYRMTTFVRPLSYASAVSDIRAIGDKSDPVAGRIASCIFDENGNPVFTVNDILYGPVGKDGEHMGPLDGNLTMALLAAIAEVTGMGESRAS